MEDDNKIWDLLRTKDIARATSWIITPGRNLNIHDPTKGTPLTRAILTNNFSIAKLLIDKGADITLGDPLGHAISKHEVDLSKLLISAGADIEKANKYGTTPLMGSVITNKIETTKALLAKGADKTKTDTKGKTALDYAKTDELRELLSSTERPEQEATPILTLPEPPSRLGKDYVEDQVAYISSLNPNEKKLLHSYTKEGYHVINSALRGNTSAEVAKNMVDTFKKKIADSDVSRTLTPSKLQDARKNNIVGGNIPEYVAQFMTTVLKAPKLKEELTLYRGIKNSADLPAQGDQLLSASLSEEQARSFLAPTNHGLGCCMLTMIVKPGVKTIWMEPISSVEQEEEILLVPPFKLDVVQKNLKAYTVTVSPAPYTRQAGTSRRKTRKARKTRRRIAFRK